MDDQDQRVEDIPKEFHRRKRPSNSSEEADSWTFLEGRSGDSMKNVDISPRPPKIALNSNLLIPDYDAEIEMSDGISVISEGEGHQTPPENDVTTAEIEDSYSAATSSKGLGIANRLKNVLDDTKNSRKYRPLNESPKDENEHEEDTDGVVTLLGANGIQPQEKTDVESFYNSNDPQRLGIYPRHVVFLMVCCGIIGGMIGHLWNMNFNCKCSERTDELARMYNELVDERWDLQQTINRYESECKGPIKEPLRWNGHQETDAHIKVEDSAGTAKAQTEGKMEPQTMPRAEFENLIWQHLRDTEKNQRTNRDTDDRGSNGRVERSADGSGKGSSNEKKYNPKKEKSAEESEEDVSHERFDSRKEYKKQQFKEHQKYKSKETKYQGQQNGKYDAGSGSDNNNNNKASKEYVKQKYDSNNKYHKGGGGGGSGEKPPRFRQSKQEESAEDDNSKENYQRGRSEHPKKKKPQSGEWSDKRNRGRDEWRQQRPQEGEKKNWYLERGSEREINRVETSTN